MRTRPGRAARADAVADGVFNQRLQNQVGDKRVEGARIDFGFDAKAIVEARLLNVDVLLQERELLMQRDFVHADAVERHAQQVGELERHVLGGFAVVASERGDGVQRVEQEVRLELDLQHFELSVGQLRFELRGKQLALLIFAVERDGLGDQHDVPVARDVHEGAREHVREVGNGGFFRPGNQGLSLASAAAAAKVRTTLATMWMGRDNFQLARSKV